MILGTDAAGVDPDGNEVVLHAVIGDPDWRDDETLDPTRTLLSELHQGTLAERSPCRGATSSPSPRRCRFAEAASRRHRVADRLPDALHPRRLQARRDRARPGRRRRARHRRDRARRRRRPARLDHLARRGQARPRRVELGADQAFESGARLPDRVDCVIESVGEATWEHSIKSLRPGGRLVVSGATSGHKAVTDLRRVFFLQLNILGSTMGTRDELEQHARLHGRRRRQADHRPHPAALRRPRGLAAMAAGELFGKIVLEPYPLPHPL